MALLDGLQDKVPLLADDPRRPAAALLEVTYQHLRSGAGADATRMARPQPRFPNIETARVNLQYD